MVIFTDGACSQNGTWQGGWGIVIIQWGKKTKSFGGFKAKTTNNEMELTAILKALEYFHQHNVGVGEILTIYSDSAYIVNCFKNKWYLKWEINGWKTSSGAQVANLELWKEILTFYKKYGIIDIEKVKGHDDNPYNNEADKIAVYCKNTQTDYYEEY